MPKENTQMGGQNLVGMNCIIAEIQQRRWRWLGHVMVWTPTDTLRQLKPGLRRGKEPSQDQGVQGEELIIERDRI